MSGLLSSLGVLLRYAHNVSEDGVAKGTLKTLEDKKIQLLRADGSMLRLLNTYIVEPIAVVSDDLKDVEELDSILGLHMDLFTGYYMQVFEILRTHYGLSVSVAVDTLATDNGGLNRVISKGISAGISLSTEDTELMDYLGELVNAAGGANKLSTESVVDVEHVNIHANILPSHVTLSTEDATVSGDKIVIGKTQSKHLDRIKQLKQSSGSTPALKGVTPAKLSAAHKDLLIPNAIQRTIEISAETIVTDPSSGDKFSRTVIIPVTIKLAVIFTSKDNILNAIESKSDEYSFSSRLDDYRSGAISLIDFVLAADLVSKYKRKKLKDKDALLTIMNSRELSSNTKMLTNGFAGFEKYYNMYIVSPEVRAVIERSVKGKLSTPKGKDTFLERANGLSITIVDPDYERIQIMVKDIRGRTDLSFKNAIKKDKNGSDYGEIIKAMMASKPPSF